MYTFVLLRINIPEIISNGKILVTAKPILILLKLSVIIPKTVGPTEQPKSPAKASSANIAVEPPLKIGVATEKTPGHIIPTVKPEKAQAKSEIILFELTAVVK